MIDIGNNGEIISTNKLIPTPKSAQNLQVPKLRIQKVDECEDCIGDKVLRTSETLKIPAFKKAFDLTIETDAVALYVWMEAGGKIFQTNFS